MPYKIPNPWIPRYALPANARRESPGMGAMATGLPPRGTFDFPMKGNGGAVYRSGYAVPQYVKDEGIGRGAFATSLPPQGTGLPKAGVGWSELGSLGGSSLSGSTLSGPTLSRSSLSGSTLYKPTIKGPVVDYGKKTAVAVLAAVNKAPPSQRKVTLKAALDRVSPRLWPSVDQKMIEFRRKGLSPRRALRAALGAALSNGLAEEVVRAGVSNASANRMMDGYEAVGGTPAPGQPSAGPVIDGRQYQIKWIYDHTTVSRGDIANGFYYRVGPYYGVIGLSALAQHMGPTIYKKFGDKVINGMLSFGFKKWDSHTNAGSWSDSEKPIGFKGNPLYKGWSWYGFFYDKNGKELTDLNEIKANAVKLVVVLHKEAPDKGFMDVVLSPVKAVGSAIGSAAEATGSAIVSIAGAAADIVKGGACLLLGGDAGVAVGAGIGLASGVGPQVGAVGAAGVGAACKSDAPVPQPPPPQPEPSLVKPLLFAGAAAAILYAVTR